MERLIINNGYDELTDEIFDEMIDGKVYGTIDLAALVANINEWYDTTPNMYGLILGLTQEEIEKILYYSKQSATSIGAMHRMGVGECY